MANFFDSTLGGATSNSYASLAQSAEALESLPPSSGISDWLAYTDTEKEQTLVAATMVLDPLAWIGCKCSEEQQLNWPRKIRGDFCENRSPNVGYRSYLVNCEEMPHKLIVAVSYLAAFLGSDGGFAGVPAPITADEAASLQSVKDYDEVRIGPITVRPKQEPDWENYPETNLERIPPFVADLIKPYLQAFGMTEGRTYRTSVATAHGHYIGSPAYSGRFYLRNGKVSPRFGSWW